MIGAASMSFEDARAFAFTLMEASGKTSGQIWMELRRALGFPGSRRRADPPYAVVLDAVASLVWSANQDAPADEHAFLILVHLHGRAAA